MKNLKVLTILLVFVISLLAANALDATDVKLGDSSQERGGNATQTITITNAASSAISDLTVTFQGVNTKYDVAGRLSAVTISAGGTVTLTVEGYVPLDFDAVDSEGKKKTFDIGDILISGKFSNGTSISKTVNLLMEAENKLRFGSNGEISINDEVKSLRDNKDFKEIRRGDTIKLALEIENRFSTSGDCEEDGTDCDIEDITANVESSDSQLDVSEDVDFSTVRPNKEATETLTFDIPDDVDEDEYDIDLWVTGTDENGALHGDFWTINLDIEVPSDEVSITSVDLSPESLACDQNTATLTVKIKNTGTDDQDDVSIWIDSSKLDIKDSVYNLELDEEDTTTKTFELDIPKGLAAGNYYIQIIANVNYNDETDRQVATLTLKDCSSTTTNPPVLPSTGGKTNTTDSNTDVNIIEVPPSSGVIYGSSKPTSFADSTEFVMILGGMLVLGLLLLIVLVVVLLKK